MIKPPTSSSAEIAMVNSFYDQSFAQLSQYYEQSFDHLLWILGVIGGVVGIIAPYIVWFFTDKNYKKLELSTKQTIKDLEDKYKAGIEVELRKMREEFGEEKKQLTQKIKVAQGEWLAVVAPNLLSYKSELILSSLAINAFIEAESDVWIDLILLRILKALQVVKKEELPDQTLDEVFKKIRDFKQNKSLSDALLYQVEEEFKKAKERE